MKHKLLAVALVSAALLAVPLFVHDAYIRHLFIIAFLLATVAASWDLTLGYTGLFNFGHVAFFGMGVYTAGILTVKLGITPWLSIPAAALIAAAAAAAVAIPALRLRGIYVVLVTFAFSQICLQFVLSQGEWTGGAGGIVRVPPLEIGDYNFARDGRFAYYYVALVLCTATILGLIAVAESRLGKSARAVRDNPEYAAARGVNQAWARLAMLVISSVPSGIAGATYCIYFRVAAPEVFGFSTSTLILSMLLVGGVSSIVGPAAASIGIVMLSEYLEQFPDLKATKHMVLAVVIILVLRFFPGGLVQFFQLVCKRFRGESRVKDHGSESKAYVVSGNASRQ